MKRISNAAAVIQPLLFALPLLAHAVNPVAKTTRTYKTVGDCAIQADVYRSSNPGAHPAVLWIHGGALIMGSRRAIPEAQLRRYLEAGFAVVAIDCRLAPETKLPEILQDIEDAHRLATREVC
jgi:acetyl esterase/lipase